jgi:hypothetical protein
MTNHAQNYKVESEAFKILKKRVNNLILADKKVKGVINKILGISSQARPYDAVALLVPSLEDVQTIDDFVLYEIKSTEKKLVNFPDKFFFGIFGSEIELWNQLGHGYKVALICTHPETENVHFLKNWEHTKQHAQGLRIQYNLTIKNLGGS